MADSVLHGTVSWPGKGDEAGELLLRKMSNVYCIIASNTAGHGPLVCELYMFYSFTSKSPLTKSELY